MPAAEYHRLPRASKSGLDKIARSPAHYRWFSDNPSDPTKSMQLGTALHSLIFDGVSPLVMPEFHKPKFSGKGSTTLRREWEDAHGSDKEDWLQANAGALIVSADELGAIHSMRDALMAHPIIGTALRGAKGRPEVSALWTCPDTGIECKSRFDWLLEPLLLDLKTTTDASPFGFARSIANFRYHVQDAFYSQAAASEGLDVRHFLFAGVETSPPYLCAIYQLDDEAREIGRRLYLRDLRTYQQCVERNEWPGYSPEIQTLSLPKWATYVDDSNEH